MKFVAVKWTFVFLISELCHGVTTLKPILEPANDLVIQEGDELRLDCQGEGRLHFTTQTYTSNINGSEIEILNDEDSGKITFIRRRTKKEDTGWYACAEKGVSVWNDEQNTDHAGDDNIAWIYVFVNSSKPFAVDSHFTYLTAVSEDRFVIPCRTTSSAISSVQLKFSAMDVPAHSTYDPKIGFILNEVYVRWNDQTFECRVDGSETKMVSYILKVIEPEGLKCPKINPNQIRHVIRGRNLSVDCEIDVPYGTKWFNMSWQVPKSVPEGRLSIVGPELVSDVALHRTWKTELRIENFKESYDGVYYCIANASSGHKNTTTAIKSLDPEYTYYIDARGDVTSNIVQDVKKTAQWKIVIDSHPEEFDWKWYDPHNRAILHKGENEGNKTAKYSYDQYTEHNLFRIRDLNLSDNGHYTIEFSNKFNRTVVNLQLTVRAEPSVSINEVRPYYSPGESADFECHSFGGPLPNITWLIKEYPNITSKESSDVKLLQNPTTKRGPKGDYHLVSTINVKINHGADLICKSCNEIGCVESTKRIVAGKPHSNTLWISIVCVLVLIIIVIGYLGIRSWLRLQEQLDRFEKGDPESIDPNKPVDDQTELLPYDKKWEVARNKVTLGHKLGSGAFGIVRKAEARDICGKGEVTIAAVKMVQKKTGSDMESLIRELKIMIYVGRHPNVVNLLGACTRRIYSGDELYVIVEYCRQGNLESYLQNHKSLCDDRIDPLTEEVCFHKSNRLSGCVQNGAAGNIVGVGNQPHAYVQHGAVENIVVNSNNQGDRQNDDFKPIRTEDLLQWAWQVSQGMEYLSSRNVLHRDLATRNILLADNDTVKICDFGLAKNVCPDVNYTGKGDTLLPIKWMAVESIVDCLFSTQSDVWSFGIVLWEFFTLADTPYRGMGPADQKNRLFEGYRMEKPKHATNEIYNIMRDCWKTFPSERPTFPELTKKFSALINGSPNVHDTSASYALSTMDRPYVSMNNGILNNGRSDHPMSISRSHRELPNLDMNINIRDESFPLQMSSPTISDFEYCNEYPRPLETESFGEQQANMSEESYDENRTGRDSGYSSVAMVSPPPTSTIPPSIQFNHNPLNREGELFPDRGEAMNVSGKFSPSEINDTESSDSEDFNEYVGMFEPENLRVRGAGSSGQRFEDAPVGEVSGYCSIAMVPAPPETSNRSSEGVTYVPVIQNGNSASKLVSRQSNYIARPDVM